MMQQLIPIGVSERTLYFAVNITKCSGATKLVIYVEQGARHSAKIAIG